MREPEAKYWIFEEIEPLVERLWAKPDGPGGAGQLAGEPAGATWPDGSPVYEIERHAASCTCDRCLRRLLGNGADDSLT